MPLAILVYLIPNFSIFHLKLGTSFQNRIGRTKAHVQISRKPINQCTELHPLRHTQSEGITLTGISYTCKCFPMDHTYSRANYQGLCIGSPPDNLCWHMEETGKSRVEERLFYACFNQHHKCVEHIVQNNAEYILKSSSRHCSGLPEYLIKDNGFRALRVLFRSGLKMERFPPDIPRQYLGKNVQVAQVLFAQGVLPEKDADPNEIISLAAMCRKTIRYQLMIYAGNDDMKAAVQQLPLPERIKDQLEGPIATGHCPEKEQRHCITM